MGRCAVDRMACVDVPALPLQLLLRAHPGWETQPVAVVDRDKPQGLILWVNDRARGQGILRGMRYATGLALSRELRAGPVPDAEIAAAVELLTERLWRFSPRIEPSPSEPGIFWLDASGLQHVFPSLEGWAASIRKDLLRANFQSIVAVGFTRFGVYATARANRHVNHWRGSVIFAAPEQEQAHVRAVPIDRLRIDPSLRDTLLKLGIRTLDGFIALPPEGIAKRFGPEAYALHQMARDARWAPLQPRPIIEPAVASIALDDPESNVEGLLVVFKELMRTVIATLAERHEALASLDIALTLDDRSRCSETLAPAVPTRDLRQLLGLLRLRLESLTLTSGVTDIAITATSVSVSIGQLDLFSQSRRRDLEAVHRAFAQIRAELGNGAVVYAKLHDAQLPEARFSWEPMERPAKPDPQPATLRPLVRRIFSPAVPLPPRTRHEPDGWMIARMADGPVEEVIGPQLVNGGWWNKTVSRAYHYVRTRSGRWLWIYHDQERRRWYLQAEVE